MKESTKGHIAIIIANIIFGLSAPISKVLFNDFLTYSQLLVFRSLGGAILFWGASLLIPRESLKIKEIGILVIAAFVGVIFNQGLYLAGLARTTPIQTGLLQTLGPVYTLFLAFLILKEPLSFKKILGVLIGMVGALILIFSEYRSQILIKNQSYLGDILIILSGISFALYLTLFIDLIKKYSPITLMKWLFLIATLFLIPFYFNDLKDFSWAEIIQKDKMGIFLSYLGYVVVFGTFIGYILVAYTQKRIRPTVVSMYVYIQPIIMSIVSIYWGLGTLRIHQIIAAVFIFCGVYIVTISKKKGTFLIK